MRRSFATWRSKSKVDHDWLRNIFSGVFNTLLDFHLSETGDERTGWDCIALDFCMMASTLCLVGRFLFVLISIPRCLSLAAHHVLGCLMLKSGRVLSAIPLPDLGLGKCERTGEMWRKHVK